MLCFITRKTGQYQRVNVAAFGMTASVPMSQIKLSDWSGFQPTNQGSLSCDIGTAIFTRIYIFLGNLGEINIMIYIYHLFTETEGNSVFYGRRPPLLLEAKPRATTAVEGPLNTLLSRGLSK